MTEKEFEQLKVGDKVWIFLSKPKETFVIAKQKDIGSGILSVKVYNGGFQPTYCAEYVFLTKSEALEAEIKHEEKIVENNERGIAKAKERIDRYKEELAKAKEEEESCWITDSGEVRKVRKSDYPCYIHYATEREAYEALAKFYKGKYEEALIKSGKARFVIRCGDKICLVQDVEKDEGNMVWVSDCDGFSLYVPKENVFPTRQEAETELERRKQND